MTRIIKSTWQVFSTQITTANVCALLCFLQTFKGASNIVECFRLLCLYTLKNIYTCILWWWSEKLKSNLIVLEAVPVDYQINTQFFPGQGRTQVHWTATFPHIQIILSVSLESVQNLLPLLSSCTMCISLNTWRLPGSQARESLKTAVINY